jgi:hypothetical protein
LPWILGRMPADYRPIVIDNGSTDGSGEVALALGATVVPEPTRGLNLADRRFGYPLEMVVNAAAPSSTWAAAPDG